MRVEGRHEMRSMSAAARAVLQLVHDVQLHAIDVEQSVLLQSLLDSRLIAVLDDGVVLTVAGHEALQSSDLGHLESRSFGDESVSGR